VVTILLLAAVIGLAYATYPQKSRSRSAISDPWNPNSPYFIQRLGRVDLLQEQLESAEARGRKYKISAKKTKKNKPVVEEDSPEDDEEQDDDVEDEEQEDEAEDDLNDDSALGLPRPWQQLFPNQEDLPENQQGGGGGGPQGGYSGGGGGPQGGGGYREDGPPPQNNGHNYGSGVFQGSSIQQGAQPQHRFRGELPWDNEPEQEFDSEESEEQEVRPRRYPIISKRLDRTGKQVRIITGWSDTVLQDNFNPEYIANPTLMALRRKRRYHPSQRVPLQKIPLRGYYGNPRDTYINPYGGQRWTGGAFEPYVYSHSRY